MKTNAPADAFASALGAFFIANPEFPSKASTTSPTLVVGYSGGCDSSVLLQLAFAYAQRHGLGLRAIHINHQLQPAAADFAAHCRQTCQQLNIPLRIETVTVSRTDKGLEADARAARYAAFSASLTSNEILLLGQHADDQLETLMLQLLRGAGPAGLAGMPGTARCGAGWLCRPLLEVRRDALHALATQRNWRWVEDPSNADHALARNRLRHELMPVLLAQREGAAGVLLRAARWQAEAADLLIELAALDATTVSNQNGLLSRSRLLQLSKRRQANLLRGWLQAQQAAMPNADRLQSFLDQLSSDSDQVALRWADQQLRTWRDQLVLLPDWPEPDAVLQWPDWQQPLALPAGRATLRFTSESASTTLPTVSSAKSTKMLALRPPRADEALSIRWQTPGLKLALPGRQGRRELKDVFQETGVPAWLRPHWPRLFYNDECVAIPGIGVTSAGAPSADRCWLEGQGKLFALVAQLG